MTLYDERNEAIYRTLLNNSIESVLDCGCGNGKLLHKLARSKKFTKLAGLDISERRIEKAKKVNENHNIKFFCDSIFEPKKEWKEYEAIVASELIEHFSIVENKKFFNNVLDILCPQILIITTPNKSYNHNYATLYNGLRHSSHQFELDENEVIKMAKQIEDSFCEYKVKYDFCDNNHSSHLIIINKE